MTNFEKVGEFHKVFGHPKNEEVTMPDRRTAKLRINLILEEVTELMESMLSYGLYAQQAIANVKMAQTLVDELPSTEFCFDPVEAADALTDILYVTYGAGHAFGVNLDKCMEEVHDSNMSKLGADGQPIYNEVGKVMKGEDYRKPDIKSVIYPIQHDMFGEAVSV